ncbi:amino acid ABC transporter ATP-binding protein [Paenochrobactrum sp. BZR 588]|uniref:amino acid ABC transporter ATP-binding protein n=1 Tax=Paenochrobactrum TaxID=999488 RepID=UPI0035BC35C0
MRRSIKDPDFEAGLTNETLSNQSVVIDMRDVNKYYGLFHALKNITLSIKSGDIVVLCGPSGSGKSTLIRTVNHLEKHNSGTITVNGIELKHDTKSVQAVRSQLGMVFQSFNLFPHLTVLQNCTFALRLAQKMQKNHAIELAMEKLAEVNIAAQADKYPAALSGGQQQRVAIARALCLKPPILLFDEPTSALDPESVGSVLKIMEQLAETGITMVCVTHELGFARNVADHCVFMENGEIVEQAPTDRFFANPESARLKHFLSQILH